MGLLLGDWFHRDIKPANLFLRQGRVEQVAVLDFGLARRLAAVPLPDLTRTGKILGTPGYMAPEQIRSQRELSPGVDIFALGCVLFECLSGQPPFSADNQIAGLAKVLFAEPPLLRHLRQEAPEPLETLLARLLARDPKQRPADATELVSMLQALPVLPDLPAPSPASGADPTGKSSLSGEEQQLFSVIAAQVVVGDGGEAEVNPGEPREQLEGMRNLLLQKGVGSECLASGALVATLVPNSRCTATEQAAEAARLVLTLRGRWPGAAIALATGRGVLRERLPFGQAIERATQLLAIQVGRASGRPSYDDVVIDEVTAGLLDQASGRRFLIHPQRGGVFSLSGERLSNEELRPLLGKPTPCVGREQELSELETLFATCTEESVSRAVLIVAAPGIGKSRLRHEFIRRVQTREPNALVLFGHADAMSAGSAYGLLRQALRRLCGVLDGEPLAEQQRKLRQRIGLHLPEGETLRVSGVLGELCGIPLSDAECAPLRAAGQARRELGEQICQAFIDLLHHEAGAQPVLMILEDVHFADAPSIALVERMLRELPEQRLLVLALARPEVKEVFPKLWDGKAREIPLRGLSKKASERMVLEALGPQTPVEVVARVVKQAAGNVLFLEELIRAVAEGKGDDFPETVLAILQSRIARLSPEVRRVLRAGSAFGETFWRGGVLALFGKTVPGPEVDAWLEELVQSEILGRPPQSRFPQEQEYRFRHALVREAAYGLITDEDRRTAHQHAARYLEEMGEPDPLVLAEHYRSGGEPQRAVAAYLLAADGAHRLFALPAARQHCLAAQALLTALPESAANRRLHVDVLLRQVQFGLLAETTELQLSRLAEAGAILGSLSSSAETAAADQRRGALIELLRARAHYYGGQQGEAIAGCRRVLPVAEALGDKELLAFPSQMIGAVLLAQGQAAQCRPLLARAVELQDCLDSDHDRLRTLGYYAINLVIRGEYREGMALHDQAVARAEKSKQPAALSLAHTMRSSSLRLSGDYSGLRKAAQLSYELAEKSGDQFCSYMALSLLAAAHSFLGFSREAAEYRARAQTLTRVIGARMLSDWFAAGDAEIALRAGELEQALAIAKQLAPTFRKEGRLLALGLCEQVWGLALGRQALGQDSGGAGLLEAEAHLAAALAVMEAAEQRLNAAILRLEWAQLARQNGAQDQAAALRAQAVAQFAASFCPHLAIEVEQAVALAYSSEGRGAAATRGRG